MAFITTSNGHRTIIALAFIILIGTVFAFDDDSVSTASAGHGFDSDGMSGETSSEEQQQQQLTSGDYKVQIFPEDEEEKAEDMFAIDIWEDWLKKRRLHNQQQRHQQQRHRPSSPQLSIFHQAAAARTKAMTKRGPSCMMKCLSQGYLHPAQCHSLC